MSDGNFRILSLDGGGVRGAFTAAFLDAIERQAGRRLIDCFDLITGTSTGGLIAIGLALDFPAERLVRFYESSCPQLFPTAFASRTYRAARHWVAAKHDARALAASLRQFFGDDTTLAHARCPVVIPTFDVGMGKPVCLKTHHHPLLVHDRSRKAWEVGMATSSAPTYFAPFQSSWGPTYVDGGVWANRPSLVGIVEAVKYFGVPLGNLNVLSVGTTGAGFRLEQMSFAGKLPWVRGGKVVDLLMTASAASAAFASHLILDGRVSECDARTATPIRLDDARRIKELLGHGRQVAKERGAEVVTRFLSQTARARPACMQALWKDLGMSMEASLATPTP